MIISEDLEWLARNAEPHESDITVERTNEGWLGWATLTKDDCIGGRAYTIEEWQAARQQLEEERMDVIGQNGNDGLHYGTTTEEEEAWNALEEKQIGEMLSKYHVKIKGIQIDVYDVLHAFGVTNPAEAHAIKKLLKAGQRGYKDTSQDRQEAIDSIKRAMELEDGL